MRASRGRGRHPPPRTRAPLGPGSCSRAHFLCSLRRRARDARNLGRAVHHAEATVTAEITGSRRPAGRPYDYHYCCFFLLLGSKKWACINYPAATRKPAITRVRREKYGPGRGCHGIYNFLRIWHRKSPRRHVARHGGAEQNGKQSRQQRDRTSRYRQGSRPRVRTAAAGCPAPAGLHGEGAADPARPLPCELTRVGGTSPCGSASPRAR